MLIRYFRLVFSSPSCGAFDPHSTFPPPVAAPAQLHNLEKHEVTGELVIERAILSQCQYTYPVVDPTIFRSFGAIAARDVVRTHSRFSRFTWNTSKSRCPAHYDHLEILFIFREWRKLSISTEKIVEMTAGRVVCLFTDQNLSKSFAETINV